ncbi:uncharacterized protein [Procambarus clarkii]|uniref:uncharacterized protein n=1 Tax=Procambarus clarkii TaxID=6728 RepID=UPI003743FF17
MRHLLPIALLLLLSALYGVISSTQSTQGTSWYSLRVPNATLNDPGHAVLQNASVSLLQCAELASLTFPDGIFCYINRICSLHDLQVDRTIDGCLYVSNICYMQQHPKPCNSFAVVSGLEDLGRLLLPPNIKMAFDASRSFCMCLGGDLLVAPTADAFLRLAAYYTQTSTLANVWVGVQQNIWLNGRNAEVREYFPPNPDNTGRTCCCMANNGTAYFRLGDSSCTTLMNFLCQLN